MRGRKPTPTVLKVIAGNPGKRPLRLDELKPYAEIPKPPRHLKGEALKEYKRVTEELHRYQAISALDRGALAMLCTCWGRYVYAEQMIEEEAAKRPDRHGMFVSTPKGFPIQSPWLAVSNKAMEQYKTLCAEFGLTPSSRTRLPVQTTQIPLFDVNAGDGQANGTNGPQGVPRDFGNFT